MSSLATECATHDASARMVFAIEELLEFILLDDNILADQLFIVQRVNRTWQAVIRDRVSLQRKMWLTHPREVQPGAQTEFNPVLFTRAQYAQRHRAAYMELYIVNHAISKAFQSVTPSINYFSPTTAPPTGGVLLMLGEQRDAEHTAQNYESASATWRSMLLANEPLVTIQSVYSVNKLRYEEKCRHEVRTLGELHRVLGQLEDDGHHLRMYAT